MAATHEAYADAWAEQLHLIVKVRDAGFTGPLAIRNALEGDAFADALSERRSRCQRLQGSVAAAGTDVDLGCGGRRP